MTRDEAFRSCAACDRPIPATAVFMPHQQTANFVQMRQSLSEPDIPACNLLEVRNISGRVLARRFVLDPSLPREHPHDLHLKVFSGTGMEVDLWIRLVKD